MLQKIRAYPKGVPLLLVNSLLMSLGFFALIPYLSIYLTESLQWTPLLAGLLLMIRQISQQGLTFVTGMLADRLGYKLMLSIGLIVRGIGFSLFAFIHHPFGLFIAAIITGIGGAIFEPTSNGALSTLTPVSERGKIYSIKKVLSNVGIAMAALVGAVLIKYDFMYISLVCGGIFIFTGFLTYFRLPKIIVQVQPIPFHQMWYTVVKDRYFVSFTVITIGFYFMYMQMFLTIPLHVNKLSHHPQAVSIIYLLLSIMIILGQYPINRFTTRFKLATSIKWGLAFMGLGLLILGTAHQLTVFMLGFVLFVVGIMVTEPTVFDFISRVSKSDLMASYFGFASLAMALGGGVSQGVGGFLLQTGERIGFTSLLWWLAAFVSILSILGMHFLERQINKDGNASTLKQVLAGR
jgi:DHA1 family multidrug resistance protein-like MFS transporter